MAPAAVPPSFCDAALIWFHSLLTAPAPPEPPRIDWASRSPWAGPAATSWEMMLLFSPCLPSVPRSFENDCSVCR